MSGSICAPTASRTVSSRPTATSSTLPARPGTPSPQSRPSYNPSECENGRTPVNHEGRWYYISSPSVCGLMADAAALLIIVGNEYLPTGSLDHQTAPENPFRLN